MIHTPVVIIGAGPAGLACAACLDKKGIEYILLEKQSQVASSWRNHYDRLHLHTNKELSHLPYKKFDATVPRYPSRDEVIRYTEEYQLEMKIKPVFNTEVKSIHLEQEQWIINTDQQSYQTDKLILATGANHKPYVASPIGLESFPGTVLHSSAYKNGKPFKGKRVLVVGFGNTAGEQAIDLFEYGAFPSLSVRSPVNVIPREVFGIPSLKLGLLCSFLPPALADRINAPLINYLIGDLTELGLKKSELGPIQQINAQAKIPLLDIGTISLIRQGHVVVYGGIDHIEGTRVYFEGNKLKDFDVIILATGYTPSLEGIINLDRSVMEDLKKPMKRRQTNGKDGLYCCGYYISPTGMLREIGVEAGMIAASITKVEKIKAASKYPE